VSTKKVRSGNWTNETRADGVVDKNLIGRGGDQVKGDCGVPKGVGGGSR